MKKGISSTMMMIVVLVLGLFTIAFGFLFFGSAGETLQEKFNIFAETAEPNCDERCVLDGFKSGVCLSEDASTVDCADVYTEYCRDGKDCCCRR